MSTETDDYTTAHNLCALVNAKAPEAGPLIDGIFEALQSARQQGFEQGRRAGMEEAAKIAGKTAAHEEQARRHAAEIKSDEASYRLWTRQTADGIAAAILEASQSPTPKEA